MRSQSDLSGVNATGQVNAGYVSEGKTSKTQDLDESLGVDPYSHYMCDTTLPCAGVAPSEFSNSDFSLATGSRIFEVGL